MRVGGGCEYNPNQYARYCITILLDSQKSLFLQGGGTPVKIFIGLDARFF